MPGRTKPNDRADMVSKNGWLVGMSQMLYWPDIKLLDIRTRHDTRYQISSPDTKFEIRPSITYFTGRISGRISCQILDTEFVIQADTGYSLTKLIRILCFLEGWIRIRVNSAPGSETLHKTPLVAVVGPTKVLILDGTSEIEWSAICSDRHQTKKKTNFPSGSHKKRIFF